MAREVSRPKSTAVTMLPDAGQAWDYGPTTLRDTSAAVDTDVPTDASPFPMTSPSTSIAAGLVQDLSQGELIEVLSAAAERLSRDCSEGSDRNQDEAAFAIEASGVIHRTCERLGVLRLDWLYQVETSGLWALDGSRSFAAWLARRDRLTWSQANRDAKLARLFAQVLPRTAAAARRGDIGLENARLIGGVANSQARIDALTLPLTAGVSVDSDSDGPVDSDSGTGDSNVPDPNAEAGNDSANPRTGEDVLVALALQHTPKVMRRIADHFANVADADASDRAFRDAATREYFKLSPTIGGYHVEGFLTQEHGQILAAALRSIDHSTKAASTSPSSSADGHESESSTRSSATNCPTLHPQGNAALLTWSQRQAIALTGLARLAAPLSRNHSLADLKRTVDRTTVTDPAATVDPYMAFDPQSDESTVQLHEGLSDVPSLPSPTAPQLTVTVSWTELLHVLQSTDPPNRVSPTDLDALLMHPPAQWEDGTGPVPAQVLRRIAATGGITRVIFGPQSQVLNVGRTQRSLTAQRRKAVTARDRHCVWPGCDAPPQLCEVHHATVHWADGGETSTDNSALLCWWHHHHVDKQNIAMSHKAGKWHFTRPGHYQPDHASFLAASVRS